ncbi:hypothetical protein [Christiangramia sp. LLG6405-1]|uniref:hypothetical protein n=1 Tax=Christiangramia sp. LLG6405-1 TaxID=3160832 RepID=UPI003868A9C5
MKFNKLLYILFLTAVLTSCEKDEETGIDSLPGEQSFNTEISNKYRLLDLSTNAYHDYFKMTDNTLGFNSLKSSHHKEYSMVQKSEIQNFENKSVSLNGQKIALNESNKSRKFDDSNIYGKTLNLSFTNNKSSGESTEVELYIPKKLNISKPVQQLDSKVSILAYYKNFLLEWNSDPKNEEGLMVAVEYLGETLSKDGNKLNRKNIVNVDHIENDNGRYILKEAMFDDIPNLSFVNLILMRGNVDIIEIEGASYKTYAESHQRIPILLVKDLNSVKGFNE